MRIVYVDWLLKVLHDIGLKFWKTSARKFYAVPEVDLQMQRGRKRSRLSVTAALNSNCSTSDDTLAEAKDEIISAIAKSTEKILSNSLIPLGLKKLLQDSLKCHICQAVPFIPPIVMAKCCKSILGCEACVNGWYSGPEALNKTCPRCRAERGYNETMTLLGLDELSIGVKQHLGNDNA